MRRTHTHEKDTHMRRTHTHAEIEQEIKCIQLKTELCEHSQTVHCHFIITTELLNDGEFNIY